MLRSGLTLHRKKPQTTIWRGLSLAGRLAPVRSCLDRSCSTVLVRNSPRCRGTLSCFRLLSVLGLHVQARIRTAKGSFPCSPSSSFLKNCCLHLLVCPGASLLLRKAIAI